MPSSSCVSHPSEDDRAWTINRSHEIYSNGFFRLRRDECSLANAPGVRADWFVLELPDCVSVVPLTDDGRIVLIEQYRHGVGDWVLECPGGSIDASDPDAAAAARRELFEETGYAASDIIELGASARDPGSQSTRVHTFLARDCRLVGKPAPESFEAIRLRLVTREQLGELINAGANFDAATLASLMRALALAPRAAN
jgi:8-oxo-dGTP pyrophosphatase MutT (NUDIX family)